MRKEKKRLKKEAKEVERLASNQEKIIDKVRSLKNKNERLEEYFGQGMNVKKLRKGEQMTGRNGYNPLDDISFEDVDDLLEEPGQGYVEQDEDNTKRKKSKKGKKYGQSLIQ